ncbi:MAG: hypothetical protein AAFU67_11285 [Bacteroidota bacterium]
MKRREINIFSIAFLDLLSGALAAVIILFVVVPKQDAEAEEAQATLEELNLEANQLGQMVADLENSVDSSVFKALNQQFSALTDALAATQSEVSRLEGERQAAQKKARTLASQNEKLETKNQQLAQQNQSLAAANTQTQQENRQLRQDAAAAGAQTFGVKAEVAIIFKWTANADVDIHLRDVNTGDICNFDNKITGFARLLEDRRSSTGEDYEMIYQSSLVPGNYELYIHLYEVGNSSTSIVNTSGYILVYPYTDRSQRIPLGPVRLSRSSEPVLVKTFTLSTTNGIS